MSHSDYMAHVTRAIVSIHDKLYLVKQLQILLDFSYVSFPYML